MYYIEGIHGVVKLYRRQIGRDKPLWSIQYRGRPYIFLESHGAPMSVL